ncbi:glycosyltransferase family 4 protein [Pontivivens insulae]|uniref:D-inositol-3-phosphate glycosyltransferase n=1 Tax=Pontivivens insulae TaxID=1639689 RepID=A0A2R8A838_9RHOB|nr:glycosyltransferase family 1 protein [Pontivivens insulae]RED18494.1 glycosyltransferase involved in cell wall biosynthesis [Pontivivens insulae]SPF28392.1 D-inositol-3-phosphate glycosyltransferase [Pontivivens insulae]
MTVRVCVDLTRTANRKIAGQPTGIDRVEADTARLLLSNTESCAVFRSASSFQLVDGPHALEPDRDRTKSFRPLRHLADGIAQRAATYLSVGHNLPPAELLVLLKKRGVRIVVMVHDIIPVLHPSYATSASRRKAERQWPAVAAHADCIIHLTDVGRRKWMNTLGEPPEGQEHVVIRPPVHRPLAPNRPVTERHGFLAVGTIEPRKNTGFLLDIWERMPAAERPALTIVGRAGWESQDLLNRLHHAAQSGVVTWHQDLDDPALAALYHQSEGLVFPSLAEGFGLPIAEAILADLPVIATDLEELREVHREAVTLLPATSPEQWIEAIHKNISQFSSISRNFSEIERWGPNAYGEALQDVLG